MHSPNRLLAKDDLNRIIDLTTQIAQHCTEKQAIYAALENILPFQGIIACRVMTSTTSQGLEYVYNLGYSTEWIKLYNNFGYHRIDPVVTTTIRGLVNWRRAFKYPTPDQKCFIEKAGEYGLIDGFSVRHQDTEGLRVTSFAGKELCEHPRHAAIIELVSPYLQLASERVDSIERNRVALSDREVEVLHWVAAGKTNWEIARILLISERTVKFHLGNSMLKLKSSTRSQAVAKAFSCGILSP